MSKRDEAPKPPPAVEAVPPVAPANRVFVDSRVSPHAAAYVQGAEGRRRAMVPRYTDPVAGGPDVPIPHLAGNPPAPGMTMAAQAIQERVNAAAAMPQPGWSGGIVQPQSASPPPQPVTVPQPVTILPADLLPAAASNDPMFQAGHGSMYAVNQPQLAHKYGVMRGGKLIPPQQLAGNPAGGAPGKLSQQTLEGLEAVRRFQETRERVEAPVDPTAQPKSESEQPLTEEQKKAILADLDDFDFDRAKRAAEQDVINNEEQRRVVEARLRPLSLEEIIITGRVTQVVPIIPGVFEPEFQSYQMGEDLILKRMIGEEDQSLRPTTRYLLDKYRTMGLTIALRSLNKKLLPSHQDQHGKFDDALFWIKYEIVAKFDYHMMASLSAHWHWFDIRVRALFKAEALGNG